MITKRALPRASTSPARFRPFCSVSQPSTTISSCTLTGFRYSTVSSAVTARTSRNRQTFPIASSSSVAMVPFAQNKTSRNPALLVVLDEGQLHTAVVRRAAPKTMVREIWRQRDRCWCSFLCALCTLHLSSVLNLCLRASNQSHTAALCTSHTTLSLPHLDPQQFRQGHHPARNLLFVQSSKAQAQRIR